MKKVIISVEKLSDNFSAVVKYPEGMPILVTGATFSEIQRETRQAIDFWIESSIEDGDPIPENLSIGGYDVEFEMSLDSYLDFFGSIITQIGMEEITGISNTQFWRYKHSGVKPRAAQKLKIQNKVHSFAKELLSIQLV